MITRNIYNKLYKKYKILSFSPKDDDELDTFYELACTVIANDIEFTEAVRICLMNSDKYPTHIDLKNALGKGSKSYTYNEIFADHKEGTELFYIKHWVTNNCSIYHKPNLDSHDYRHRTQAQADEWSKQEDISQAIVMKQVKEMLNNPRKSLEVTKGIEYKQEQEQLALEKQNADEQKKLIDENQSFKKIGMSETKTIKQDRKKDGKVYILAKDFTERQMEAWTKLEVESRKAMDTHEAKPWKINTSFDYEGMYI